MAHVSSTFFLHISLTHLLPVTTHQLEWVAVRLMSSRFLRLQLLKGEKRQREEDGENGMVGEGERGRGRGGEGKGWRE